MSKTATRSRLGELLVSQGLLQVDGLRRAMDMQASVGHRLGTNLLELGLVDEKTLLAAIGQLHHVQTISAESLATVPPELVRLLPPKLARRYQIIPVERRGGTLLIASCDPGDALVEDEIGSLTGCLARTVVALEIRLQAAMARYYQDVTSARLIGLNKRLDAATRGIPSVASARATASTAKPRSQPESPPPPVAPHRRPAAPVGGEAVEPLPEPRPRKPDPPRYIELDSDERARIFSREAAIDRPLDERLADVSEALIRSEIRDEIADQVLAFCAPIFRRRVLLVRREGRILGWRGEGEGIEREGLRRIDIPCDGPSLFQSLGPGSGVWRGPLPPFPAHQTLEAGLGSPPRACVVLPILVRDRIACYLYGDNLAKTVADVPVDTLQRLAQKMGTAFEVIILKNRIRSL